jgi:restriction system protein
MEKNYWVIHMGEANKYAGYAYENNLVAIGWNELGQDLNEFRTLNKKEFFKSIIPLLEEAYEINTKSNAMIAGQLFRFSSLMEIGDIVLVPKTKEGKIFIGSIEGSYCYQKELRDEFKYHHRREVKWIKSVSIQDLSENLRKSIGAMMTIFSANKYTDEIESLLSKNTVISNDIESLESFGLESQLEEFIVENWNRLSLGKNYEIVKEDGEIIGQQYVTPVGRIDILAKNKNGKEWLVIELKKGKSSDHIIGQTLRYIAWIKENEAGADENVKGLIITKDQDEKLKYSLKATSDIESMTYSVDFQLNKPL